jgi:hypothetical protein
VTGGINRRQTLALGAAGAVAATAVQAVARPVLVVFDGRYSDARRFADRAGRAGAQRFDARGDLARLWQDLDARPWRIVALTTAADFGLGVAGGRERGLSLQGSGLHDGRAGDGLEHRLDGFSEAALRPRLDAGLEWPDALAELMLLSPVAGGGVRFRTARADDHPGTLTSWRMA